MAQFQPLVRTFALGEAKRKKQEGIDRYITLTDKERPNDLPRPNFFLRKIIGIRLLPQTLKVEIPE